jgi:hypothetical protein
MIGTANTTKAVTNSAPSRFSGYVVVPILPKDELKDPIVTRTPLHAIEIPKFEPRRVLDALRFVGGHERAWIEMYIIY